MDYQRSTTVDLPYAEAVDRMPPRPWPTRASGC